MPDLHCRLMECFAAVFPGLGEAEIPRASFTSVAKWDSLATITLIGVLEEEFGVSVPPDDLELLVSFELILDYLRSKTSAA
ncbi:MAG: acyl carrier protein [Candidatus Brocadiae bacterium]|nr:acyl carrier protein [Candidatus Brocadiia bacterium]